jgi:hypothetical protein
MHTPVAVRVHQRPVSTDATVVPLTVVHISVGVPRLAAPVDLVIHPLRHKRSQATGTGVFCRQSRDAQAPKFPHAAQHPAHTDKTL